MLSSAAIDFLEGRGLCPETAARYGIDTANVTGLRDRSPVLVFPYMEAGAVINEKFRMLPKQRFWQHSGRKKIFWNADALDDPGLASGQYPLIVTEGELDALVAIQCGFPLTVSVPDGAPPDSVKSAAESGANDQDGRFSFLWNARDKLKRVKRFVIATDADGPGRRLQEELVRRLSAGRCSFVEYPMGCKDLNDVLLKHGQEAVVRLLTGAKQCPVRGLYRLGDYPDAGPLEVFNTGWGTLDRHFKLVPGEFVVITGIPQHGKSSFTLHLLANLAREHGWRSAIFSPEMRVVPIIRDRFRSIRTGKHPQTAGPDVDAWIADSFAFIGADPVGGVDDEDFDLDWILDKATEAVLRDGIRVLLIDPWNEVEHARAKNESSVDYIARGIRALKRFARAYNVVVIVIAHPTKLAKHADGTLPLPSLYDIADAAHWYNKCDHGIVVYRDSSQPGGDISEIHVVKSRFDEAGEPGMVQMKFDPVTHRFYLMDHREVVA